MSVHLLTPPKPRNILMRFSVIERALSYKQIVMPQFTSVTHLLSRSASLPHIITKAPTINKIYSSEYIRVFPIASAFAKSGGDAVLNREGPCPRQVDVQNGTRLAHNCFTNLQLNRLHYHITVRTKRLRRQK